MGGAKGRAGLPRVLMYHSVHRPRGGPDALCVSPERFEEQMLYLARRGLRGVCMRDLRAAMDRGGAGRLVGLTFDDGYADFLGAAVPVLARLGFSATVFVVAGMLGGENGWEHRGGTRPRLGLLGADGVREAAERGMEVGSHTLTHPRLPGLEEGALAREIGESRRVLGEVLGAPVDGFCYPYGDLDERAVRAAREAGYAYACATKKRVEYTVHDWPRVFVGDGDNPLKLGLKLKIDALGLRRRGR